MGLGCDGGSFPGPQSEDSFFLVGGWSIFWCHTYCGIGVASGFAERNTNAGGQKGYTSHATRGGGSSVSGWEVVVIAMAVTATQVAAGVKGVSR